MLYVFERRLGSAVVAGVTLVLTATVVAWRLSRVPMVDVADAILIAPRSLHSQRTHQDMSSVGVSVLWLDAAAEMVLATARRTPSVSAQVHVVKLAQGLSRGADVVQGALKPLISEVSSCELFRKSCISRFVDGYAFNDGYLANVSGEAHPYQVLATLLDAGMDASSAIETRGGEVLLGRFLEHALANAGELGSESEWAVMVMLRVARNQVAWTTKLGRVVSLESVVDEFLDRAEACLVDEKSPGGSCWSTHVFSVVVEVVEAGRSFDCLSSRVKGRAELVMRSWLQRVATGQNPEGYWGASWLDARNARRRETLLDRVLVTGHILEVLQRLPNDGLGTMASQGCTWLERTIPAISEVRTEWICPMTHALLSWKRSYQRNSRR